MAHGHGAIDGKADDAASRESCRPTGETDMRFRTLGVLAVLGLAIGARTTSAQPTIVAADVPFAFEAAGRTLPAGHYEFREMDNGTVINVIGKGKTADLVVPVTTRLASEVHGHVGDSHVVFDIVGGRHLLSEVWTSGNDGYLLHATKEAHTHHVITVQRPASPTS